MTTTFVPHADPVVTFIPSGDDGPPVGSVAINVALGYYPDDGSTSFWDSAKWDVAGGGKWAGPAPLDDVTCDVLSVTVNEGRDLPLERFRPSSATIVLDDPEGKYSPWRTAPDPSAFATVRVGIDVAIWAMMGATRYPRFVGIVDSIEDSFPNEGDRHTVTIHAVDYLSIVAAYNGTEQPAVGSGELSGTRIERILYNAQYLGTRVLDAGSLAMQPTTLAKNALDEIGLVVDTETGAFWCDRDGVLRFKDLNGLVSEPRYTAVQATFTDVDGDPAGSICYAEIKLASDTEKVKNVVSISNVGGAAVQRSDSSSIALYRPRTYQRFDLIHQDGAQSVTIANRHLAVYAYAANRVESLSLDLVTLSDAQRAAVLAIDTLWRVRVYRRAEGFQVVADLQIQGMTETITPDAWRVTFRTFSAASVFDVARWDSDTWDHGLWGY